MKKMSRLSLLISLLGGVFVWLNIDIIISILFGDSYTNSSYFPVKILIIANLVNVAFGSVGMVANMTNNTSIVLNGLILSFLVLSTSMLLFFSTFYSLMNIVLLSLVLSMVFWNFYIFFMLRRKLGINVSAF